MSKAPTGEQAKKTHMLYNVPVPVRMYLDATFLIFRRIPTAGTVPVRAHGEI